MGRVDYEILLVEDDTKDVELTLHAPRKGNLGNRIEVVRDGEEALDFVFCRGKYDGRNGADQPQLILLDLKLPKIDGLEVLAEIKKNPKTQAIPVVILTASKEEKDLVNGYRLGVNAYIQKPVDFGQFREMIREVGLFWLVVNQVPPTAAFQAQ